MARITALLAAVTLAVGADRRPASPQTPSDAPVRPALLHLLDTDLGFLPAELSSFQSGGVVARIVATVDNREVAVAGAMHVAVPLDYYAARIANVGVPTPGPAPDAGLFSSPAAASDLAGWRLAAADLKSLDFCDPTGCTMRLDAATIDRLRRDAGPRAATAADAWSLGAREAITGYIAAFQTRGAEGLPVYHNGTAVIAPGMDLPALRRRFGFLEQSYPSLAHFLDRYPADRDGRAVDRLSWSLDEVMATPILSATHLVAWSQATALADRVLVSEQIYTSREVDALVEVTLLAADTTPDRSGVTVVTVSRSVSTSLLGLTGAAKRSVARSSARIALADYMTMIRTTFEHDARR